MVLPVEHFRQHHRAAEVDSILILPIGQAAQVRIGLRVQSVVAEKFPEVAVELVRPGTRRDVDVGAAADGKLGVSDVRLNVKLLDRVRRRSNHPGVRINLIVEHAVHREVVLLAALSVNRWADAPGSEGDDKTGLLTVFHGRCSWREQRKLRKLAPIER